MRKSDGCHNRRLNVQHSGCYNNESCEGTCGKTIEEDIVDTSVNEPQLTAPHFLFALPRCGGFTFNSRLTLSTGNATMKNENR